MIRKMHTSMKQNQLKVTVEVEQIDEYLFSDSV